MADRDHHRVCDQGKAIGEKMAELYKLGRKRLDAAGVLKPGTSLPGLRTEMCASCACRAGTVPNGCLQTQLDFLKAVVEGQKFLCHAPMDGRVCAGWVGARAEYAARPFPQALIDLANEWEYSPPDEPPPSPNERSGVEVLPNIRRVKP